MSIITRENYQFRLFVFVSLIAALVGLIVLLNLPVVSKSRVVILIGIGIGIILCCLVLTNVLIRSTLLAGPRVVIFDGEKVHKGITERKWCCTSNDLNIPEADSRCAY